MIRIEHTEKEWTFPFAQYYPAVKSKNMPLVIQLHGAGERGNGTDDLWLVDRHGFSKVIADDESHNCIFVMPQCPRETFWCAKTESLLAFIEQLKEKFSIDEKRIYLTGLSMGGYGTRFTAMAKPDLFAAIAPICGGGMAWNASVLTMPVWAFHSSDDPIVSVVQSDEMIAKIREFNNDVLYSRFTGLGHDAWEKACNTELLDWLLSKSK